MSSELLSTNNVVPRVKEIQIIPLAKTYSKEALELIALGAKYP